MRVRSYRKIYEEYHETKIPKDYHIHHIDGNRDNNDIENLEMLSPDDHAKKHGYLNNWIMSQDRASKMAVEKLKTPEMRIKMSVAMKNSDVHKEGIENRSKNLEWRKNVSEAAAKTAKNRTNETWNKGKTGLYKTSEETKKLLTEQRLGRKWFTDGVNAYFIKPENAASNLRLGRK